MKRLILLAMVFGLANFAQPLWSAPSPGDTPSATFTLVKGTVIVRDKKGKNRSAHEGSKAYEGDTVHVHQKSLATLKLFDESTLDLRSSTNLVLSSLKQPSDKVKNLKFVLKVGSLFAKVKKLLTSQSSFEVEGGGIICGVRGTQFEFSYDPDTEQVGLHVFEGSVFTNKDGENNLFKAGDQMQFMNGLLQNPPVSQPNPGLNGGNNQNSYNNDPYGNNGNNLNGNGGDQGWSDSTAAVGDLSSQFDSSNGINGDNIFTDSSVEGSVKVTIHMNVPTNETHK